MIGISTKIYNYNCKYLKFYNNSNSILAFDYFEYKINIVGQIFENINIIKKKIINSLAKKIYKDLLILNGEYAILIINKKKNFLLIGNSLNSYIPLFYYKKKKFFEIQSNIFHFNSKLFKYINKEKIYEWLVFNGRSFNNETFLKNIKALEAGSLILNKSNQITLIKNKVFTFSKSNLSLSSCISLIKKALGKAINIRIKQAKKNISFGLSGGLDSRLLISIIEKNNLKKIKTHTIGSNYSFEKKISKKVSRIIGTKHKSINVPMKDYYNEAHNAVKDGGFNTVFKLGIVKKYYKNIKKNDNSNNLILGGAGDVLTASSFSDKNLLRLKSKKEYVEWYKQKHQLFKYQEIQKLFKHKISSEREIYYNFNKFLKKFDFRDKNFVDINDAFTFETRIKRWHNYTLSIYSRISNFLIPTYDCHFLKVCSQIPYKFRLKDLIRKKIISETNKNLSKIQIATKSFQTTSPGASMATNLLKKQMSKKLLNQKSYYDVNLGYDMRTKNNINKLYKKLKNKIIKSKYFNYINFSYIEKIISEHQAHKVDNTRKIFVLITLLIILIKISNKNV